MFHCGTMRNMSFSCSMLKFSRTMWALSHIFINLSWDLVGQLFNLSFLLICWNIRVWFEFLNFLRNLHSFFELFSFGSPFIFFLFRWNYFRSFLCTLHSLNCHFIWATWLFLYYQFFFELVIYRIFKRWIFDIDNMIIWEMNRLLSFKTVWTWLFHGFWSFSNNCFGPLSSWRCNFLALNWIVASIITIWQLCSC